MLTVKACQYKILVYYGSFPSSLTHTSGSTFFAFFGSYFSHQIYYTDTDGRFSTVQVLLDQKFMPFFITITNEYTCCSYDFLLLVTIFFFLQRFPFYHCCYHIYRWFSFCRYMSVGVSRCPCGGGALFTIVIGYNFSSKVKETGHQM